MKPGNRDIRQRSSIKRALAGVIILGVAVTGAAAQAKTCTVDLDEVQVLRKEILDIAKSNMHIDKDRAAAAKRKLGDALNGGSVSVDPNDLKGILSLKGKPSPAVVQDVLARLQSIIASCQ
ncbi:MAG: hypothetical protein JO172_06975 [Hyphomicrobiales bacterium]|nr:hypothetical protein [Hyphomicrobiales bacterium]